MRIFNVFRKEGRGIVHLILFLTVLYIIFFLIPELFPVKIIQGDMPENAIFFGNILTIVGALIWFLSVLLLRIFGKGSPHPKYNPTQKIVRVGTYQYVRHPIYLGFFIIVVGQALNQNSLFLMLLDFIYIFVFLYYFIPLEEKDNVRRFGPEYVKYKLNTATFFGGIPIKRQGPAVFCIIVILSIFNFLVFFHNTQLQIYPEFLENNNLLIYLGLALSAYGSVFIFWMLVNFKKKGLKTNGPYRFVRNPLYHGFFSLYIGCAFIVSSLYCLVMFLFIYLYAMYYVKYVKEPRQMEQYGKIFLDFSIRVGRFLPKMKM
jgi:protein-S-isoprenylcysteine O-methyltransferase Ste14